MSVCNLFVFILILSPNLRTNGLERTRLNAYNANANLLLSESGKDPVALNQGSASATNQAFPALGSPTKTETQNGHSSGKVHDLVNFYNNQGKVTNSPSYSSVVAGGNPSSVTTKPISPSASQSVQGTNVKNPVILTNKASSPTNPTQSVSTGSIRPFMPTSQLPTKPTTKPSWSAVVSGGDKRLPSSNNQQNIPYTRRNGASLNPAQPPPSKATTNPSFSTGVTSENKNPTLSAGKPTNGAVLPSTIVNNNNQNNRPMNSNAPTDNELQTLSEELLRKDNNNAAKLITINYQAKTTSQSKDDKAPIPLLSIPDSVYNIPTIQKFVPLLDNYERDTLVNEYVTPQERNEENAFMDVIMATPVIRHLMSFLKDKGHVTPDPRQQRDFLKQLWFNLYSRGKGKISSSGFEHVFVSELKNGEVSGLHNWLYFAREESANRANYLGYLKYEQLNDKGAVLKLHFNQQGTDKPVDSMFIGTSPELEIALYSLCFITRVGQDCPLKLGGKNVNIITHNFRYRSKNMIGSAYPQI